MIAEPDSKILLISEDMEFLVLATDGLWEKVWMNSHIHMHGSVFFIYKFYVLKGIVCKQICTCQLKR